MDFILVKNAIQFQKGLRLTDFLAQYGDEANCYQALCKFRWPNGFECPDCVPTGHCHIGLRKVLQGNHSCT
ncbi:MAG: hypothetical protein CSB34_05815 [Desulfobulbus propionicus]|nr:MAG: hypothetical protein CSB34_05815 [Desulfobulbus propionicus]